MRQTTVSLSLQSNLSPNWLLWSNLRNPPSHLCLCLPPDWRLLPSTAQVLGFSFHLSTLDLTTAASRDETLPFLYSLRLLTNERALTVFTQMKNRYLNLTKTHKKTNKKNENDRLTGFENTLLGFSSRIHPMVKSILPGTPAVIDTICFGTWFFFKCYVEQSWLRLLLNSIQWVLVISEWENVSGFNWFVDQRPVILYSTIVNLLVPFVRFSIEYSYLNMAWRG
jgi:hypothetical protein